MSYFEREPVPQGADYYMQSAHLLIDQLEQPFEDALLSALAVCDVFAGKQSQAIGYIDRITDDRQKVEPYLMAIDRGADEVHEHLSGLENKLFDHPRDQMGVLVGLITRKINPDTNAVKAMTVLESLDNEDANVQLVAALIGTKELSSAGHVAKQLFADSETLSFMTAAIDIAGQNKPGRLETWKLRRQLAGATKHYAAIFRQGRSFEDDYYFHESDLRQRINHESAARSQYIPAFLGIAALALVDDKSQKLFTDTLAQQNKQAWSILYPKDLFPLMADPVFHKLLMGEFRRETELLLDKEFPARGIANALRLAGAGDFDVLQRMQDIYESRYKNQMSGMDGSDDRARWLLHFAQSKTNSDIILGDQDLSLVRYRDNQTRQNFAAAQYAFGTAVMFDGRSDVFDKVSHDVALSHESRIETQLIDYLTQYNVLAKDGISDDDEWSIQALKNEIQRTLEVAYKEADSSRSPVIACRLYQSITEAHTIVDGSLAELDTRDQEVFNPINRRFFIGGFAPGQKHSLKSMLKSAVACEIAGHYPDYDRSQVIRLLSVYGLDGETCLNGAVTATIEQNLRYKKEHMWNMYRL